jgi:hypothetical protein
MSRINHLTILAMTPDESSRTPIFCTKSAKPERRARSLKRTAWSSAWTPFASREEIIHPTIRTTAKPMIRGIAERKVLRAPAREALKASPVSRTGTATAVPCICTSNR